MNSEYLNSVSSQCKNEMKVFALNFNARERHLNEYEYMFFSPEAALSTDSADGFSADARGDVILGDVTIFPSRLDSPPPIPGLPEVEDDLMDTEPHSWEKNLHIIF